MILDRIREVKKAFDREGIPLPTRAIYLDRDEGTILCYGLLAARITGSTPLPDVARGLALISADQLEEFLGGPCLMFGFRVIIEEQ